MRRQVTFKNTPQLRRIIRDAVEHPNETLIPYTSEPAEGTCVWFVKDDGAYLMNRRVGGKGLRNSSGKPVVVYAFGLNPDRSDRCEVIDRLRDRLGGDDFVELVGVNREMLQILVTHGSRAKLTVTLTDTKVQATVRATTRRR